MKKAVCVLITVCIVTISGRAAAQITNDADENYEKVQDHRRLAEPYWQKDKPTPEDLKTAIGLLNNTVQFLDSTLAYPRAVYSSFLIYKPEDVYGDIMRTYILAGQNDSALAYLEKIYETGCTSPEWLLTDKKYDGIKADPRYAALINKFKSEAALYKNAAFKTEYKPDLTVEEKVAGLSLLWAQAKNMFVYFDHTDVDWNKCYMDYIAKVTATKSTAEYYKVLQRFYAELKDGHTNVYPPKALMKDFYSRPPIYCSLIAGSVFITDVNSDSLRGAGIVPGLELLKIDGEPVKGYAEKHVKPYQSSSTPQDMEVREFSYFLLAGAEDKPVVLELKDKKGRVFVKEIARKGYRDVQRKPAMQYENIAGVGYLAINNFEDEQIIKQFDSLYTEIAATKGLVIDIRNNGGGNNAIGNAILGKLTGKPFATMAYKKLSPSAEPSQCVAWNERVETAGPDGKILYSGPVTLLVSAKTFSAAEDFTIAFDYMKRGKIIGQPTGGSSGNPIGFDLPGGGSARVCSLKETYPDGREFVGIGIKPDIVIMPTIKDLEDGRDAVKDKAIALMRGM